MLFIKPCFYIVFSFIPRFLSATSQHKLIYAMFASERLLFMRLVLETCETSRAFFHETDNLISLGSTHTRSEFKRETQSVSSLRWKAFALPFLKWICKCEIEDLCDGTRGCWNLELQARSQGDKPPNLLHLDYASCIQGDLLELAATSRPCIYHFSKKKITTS